VKGFGFALTTWDSFDICHLNFNTEGTESTNSSSMKQYVALIPVFLDEPTISRVLDVNVFASQDPGFVGIVTRRVTE
jgi:hypothetical protein